MQTNLTGVSYRRLWGVLLLLLVYAATRLFNLLALPLFVDESVTIEVARRFWDGDVLAGALDGRLGLVWFNAFLGPGLPGQGFPQRAGIVLVSMAALAAFYALARGLVSHRAGLLAMALWIITPYLLFFERLTLADSLLNPIGVIVVWIAWQMVQRRSRGLAVGLGAALVVAILAKLTGIFWLPLPLIALALAVNIPWRERLVLGGLAYGTFGLLWGPFTLVLRWRGYDYTGIADEHTQGIDSGLFDRLQHNISQLWHVDVDYVGWPVIVLAVLLGLYWLAQRPRGALYAVLVLGMSAGSVAVFGRDLNSRYVLSHVPWVILPLACGAGLLVERCQQRRYRQADSVVLAGLVIWTAVCYAGFQHHMWHDPAALPLNRDDRIAYISREASGYGNQAIGERLRELPEALPTLGLVANCQT
ncbi:MAG: glycosyltransferase family 39 protein, partial [Anaerolineae bacterium]|nr:glycosyltransferase family 39 protein [Anaerolineae bacterium]